jgi:enamine deaminase RidA (YjgF/YER057c/UK114 family)
MDTTPHRLVNPPELLPPVGFAHAVVAEPGRTIHLGGQTGHGPDGTLAGDLVTQFEAAAANVVTALAAAEARPDHLVSLHVYTTDVAAYRAHLTELGRAYQRTLGHHYPAMALFEVTALFDPDALVELVGVAVVPSDEVTSE